MLRDGGWLVGEPEPVRTSVKFYEKGDRPLEVISSRQWFVKTLEHKAALLERGERDLVASGVHGIAATRAGSRA